MKAGPPREPASVSDEHQEWRTNVLKPVLNRAVQRPAGATAMLCELAPCATAADQAAVKAVVLNARDVAAGMRGGVEKNAKAPSFLGSALLGCGSG